MASELHSLIEKIIVSFIVYEARAFTAFDILGKVKESLPGASLEEVSAITDAIWAFDGLARRCADANRQGPYETIRIIVNGRDTALYYPIEKRSLYCKPTSLKLVKNASEPIKPKSIEECDSEFLEELSRDKTSDGQRRYYVYDCELDDWFFVGAAHCPYSLFSSKRPPKFADIGQELRYATKRTLVVYLRTKVRELDRKIEEWF